MGVVKGQGHTIGPVSYQLTSFSLHIKQTNNSWDISVSKFDLETSKVKVMSEVKGQGPILYPVSNQYASYYKNLTMLIFDQSVLLVPYSWWYVAILSCVTCDICARSGFDDHIWSTACGTTKERGFQTIVVCIFVHYFLSLFPLNCVPTENLFSKYDNNS